MVEYKMLIGGEMVSGSSAMDILNPANEQVFAAAPRANNVQLEAAIASAKGAFKGWCNTDFRIRQTSLSRLADGLGARCTKIADVIVAEAGKPTHEAKMEVNSAIAILRYVANLPEPNLERIALSANQTVTIHRKPLGVVAGITPWNMPLMQPVLKLAMALASGNTMVLKPAPSTPLSALLLGSLAADVFPAGVLNIIVDQNELGEALTSHRDVAKISFTGSTVTGRKIMANAAPTLKRLTMELGGSDAAIILPDVDLVEVAHHLFTVATYNCGQICTAPKRIYAHKDIYEELGEVLGSLAKQSVVGDGALPETTMGPLQNATQYTKVLEYMAEAREKGTVISGSGRLDRKGYFVEPMIVKDVEEGMRVVDEEQFGPVIPLLSFAEEEEAVRRANEGAYGLGGSVWSADAKLANRLAAELDVGQAWVNSHGVSPIEAPLSGAKQSGFGIEGGAEGFNEYTQITAVIH